MAGTQHLWLFVVSGLLLNITPGPDSLFIMARSASQGWRAGVVACWGVGAGVFVHVGAAALGLSALLAAVPLAYDVVRWVGAVYLAWLAIVTWRSGDPGAENVQAPHAAPAQMFRQGLLTSVLNPKVAVFQLALFPQFVDPARGSVLAQSLVLAVTQLIIVFLGDLVCVFAATGVRRAFAGKPGWARWSKRALAGVFAGLAARLAIQSQT